MGNLQGLLDQVNTQVAGIAGQVGTTPQAWNGGVYSMIRSLSDQVILPIAGVILAIAVSYTHLDVYKRQPEYPPASCSLAAGTGGRAHRPGARSPCLPQLLSLIHI